MTDNVILGTIGSGRVRGGGGGGRQQGQKQKQTVKEWECDNGLQYTIATRLGGGGGWGVSK